MLRSVVVSPDRELSARLLAATESAGGCTVKRVMDEYPSLGELLRVLRASTAEILFLSFVDLAKARDITKALEEELPNLQIVGIHGEGSSQVLREYMRLGIRESLGEPFEEKAIVELLSNVTGHLDRLSVNHGAPSQLLCFLPSKPGVGTSTIALNVSASLAAQPNSSVLLADFDMSAGMVRFLLRLNNKSSVTDAIDMAHQLDDQLWPQLVTRLNGLDVLHAGSTNPNYQVAPVQLEEFLTFLRRHYKFVCADLSGNFERHSLDLLHESKAIFLVCTPEVASIHLAREKLDFLRQIDVSSKVSVLLNRVPKKTLLSTQQVEELLGVPVAQVFANDYNGVNGSVKDGTAIKRTSEMGKQLAEFSLRLDGALS